MLPIIHVPDSVQTFPDDRKHKFQQHPIQRTCHKNHIKPQQNNVRTLLLPEHIPFVRLQHQPQMFFPDKSGNQIPNKPKLPALPIAVFQKHRSNYAASETIRPTSLRKVLYGLPYFVSIHLLLAVEPSSQYHGRRIHNQ